jgi:hypothetical protein
MKSGHCTQNPGQNPAVLTPGSVSVTSVCFYFRFPGTAGSFHLAPAP